MSCATTCLKCLVILCNFLLVTIGLVLLTGGIVLLTAPQTLIDQYTTDLIVNSVTEQRGNWTNSSSGGGGSSPDFSSVTTFFGIVLVAFGTFITLFGFVGIFGVCCSSRVLLVIYAIVTILLVIAEIIVTILFFLHVFDDRIRSRAQNTLTEDYVGLMDLGPQSLAWNYVMIKLQCCGLDSYKDFDSAKKWLGNEIDTKYDLEVNGSQVTPLACCKQAPNFQSTSDFTCSTNPMNQTSNWKTGCWDKVAAELLPYRTVTIGIIAAIVVAQTLLALMAILIAWRLPKNWKNI